MMQKGSTHSSNLKQVGDQIYELIEELYPICRSITGDGVRKSLAILQKHIPLEQIEVPTGTEVFDWSVPKEWNIRDAWIKNPAGEKIVDFQKLNLHALNYSAPVDRELTLDELTEHIFTLPDQPDMVPYRTSYYNENWGFCMAHHQLEVLEDGDYTVKIDSDLTDGSLTYGEYFMKGESEEEILISSHICHPSLCNDNLSGVSVAVHLAKALSQIKNHYSYRFLFAPGTIGSITWLAQNEDSLSRIKHCVVLSCVGDRGKVHWKKTRNGNSEIDRAAKHILELYEDPYDLLEFSPYGYDERQFSSPGINLPAGCFMRTPWGQFPEYHTSGDDLNLVDPQSLADSWKKTLEILNLLDQNRTYINLSPKGEPQLGKRGLYSKMGGNSESSVDQMALLWVLNLSDGQHSLLDMAERSGVSFWEIKKAADLLMEADLLVEAGRNKKKYHEPKFDRKL